MTRSYSYVCEGLGSNGQTWTCSGSVNDEWYAVFEAVQLDTFKQLTQGKAVYGKPGIGCSGPYTTTRLEIKLVLQ